MKNGKDKKLHFIAVMSFVIFIVLGLASTCKSTPDIPILSSEEYFEMNRDGQVKQVGFATDIVTTKDFITVGLIFVESSVTLDSNNKIIEGSKITFDMLLKEAQKLGADDIINLRIDEIVNTSVTEEIRIVPTSVKQGENWETVDKETKVQIVTRKIDYKANALAIKYTPK
jgi:uncharacterized protein YbjQ (UPF0145 family)